jgi:hypothetical protein
MTNQKLNELAQHAWEEEYGLDTLPTNLARRAWRQASHHPLKAAWLMNAATGMGVVTAWEAIKAACPTASAHADPRFIYRRSVRRRRSK